MLLINLLLKFCHKLLVAIANSFLIFENEKQVFDQPVSSVVKHVGIGAGGLRFDFWAGQIGTVSPTVHHRCNVSSELC